MTTEEAAELCLSPLQKLLRLHEETCTECREIMRRKNHDYANASGDPFSNFRIAESYGVHPAIGILLRMTDKLQRIRTFVSAGELKVSGETVDDACDDLVNYAILIKGMLREQREKELAKPKDKDWP
jgi:hypothetical protein